MADSPRSEPTHERKADDDVGKFYTSSFFKSVKNGKSLIGIKYFIKARIMLSRWSTLYVRSATQLVRLI